MTTPAASKKIVEGKYELEISRNVSLCPLSIIFSQREGQTAKSNSTTLPEVVLMRRCKYCGRFIPKLGLAFCNAVCMHNWYTPKQKIIIKHWEKVHMIFGYRVYLCNATIPSCRLPGAAQNVEDVTCKSCLRMLKKEGYTLTEEQKKIMEDNT